MRKPRDEKKEALLVQKFMQYAGTPKTRLSHVDERTEAGSSQRSSEIPGERLKRKESLIKLVKVEENDQ